MKYIVILKNIEWDVDSIEYDLPSEGQISVNAPDEECAKDWALGDFSENHCFCIQGCEVDVQLIN